MFEFEDDYTIWDDPYYPYSSFEGFNDPYYESEEYYENDNWDCFACPFCGKDYEDFSDLGCSFCDTRVEFGL